MPSLPTLELTFRNVAGDPWEGEAVARFQGEPSKPFAVREGLTGKQREDLRWYIEQFLDFPEGGYVTRAKRIEREMDEYGRALWEGLQAPQLDRWVSAVHERGGGRLELRAETQDDEVAFRSPWELLRIGDQGQASCPLLSDWASGRSLDSAPPHVIGRVGAPSPSGRGSG